MDALPYHLRLLAHGLTLASKERFLSCLLNVKVEIHRDDRVLLKILSRLKVLVRANFAGL